MKGFVLTLDAVFSLIFAGLAISALVYVAYSDYTPTSLQLTGVSSTAGALLYATIGNLSSASPLYSASSQATWPQYGASEGYSFGSDRGPVGPYLLYSVTVKNSIIPVPVVSNNEAFFEAGNQLYAINATTGQPVFNFPITNPSPIISSPVIYKNEVIYANVSGQSGNIIAINIYNGSNVLWRTSLSYKYITTPLQIEGGYLTFAVKNATNYGQIYFIDPVNGTVIEIDPTSIKTNGPLVSWIAHYKNQYFIGYNAVKAFNITLRKEYVNASGYPSNSFSAWGSFRTLNALGSVAIYGNLSATYNKSAGTLKLINVPYYSYAYQSTFNVPMATYNTTPSIGGNVVYLLSNGIYFMAYGQTGKIFNVTLPFTPFPYNYSNIALAYGNAYVPNGNTLYVFGVQRQQPNDTVLTALGNLYLNGEAGLADYILYNTYWAGNIGIYINGSYAPELHVSKFDGIGSYINIPSKAKLSPEAGGNGAMSLCAWYKINSLTGYNGLIIKGTQSPSSGSFPEYTMDTGGSGRGFTIYNYLGSVAASYTSTIAANTVGLWEFSCFTYNTTAAYYYLNSVQYTGTVNSGVLATAGTGNLIFGAGSGGFSNVSMADVQLYNASITPARVTRLYSAGMYAAPPNLTNLVGWWPLLGDGNDYSGNGNIGFASTNVVYINSYYLPTTLQKASYITSATAGVQLTSNGVKNRYNVSVVTWSN